MKSYTVSGTYHNFSVIRVVVDNGNMNQVRAVLWIPKSDFDNIPTGQKHYDFITLDFHDPPGYLSMLFDDKPAATARKYIKKLGLKIIKPE